MIIDSILNLVNKFIPDSDAANKLAAELSKEQTKQMEMQSKVIQAELAQGGITSKWRPITMILFVGMIVVHFLMYDVIPFIRTTMDLNFYVPQDPGFTDGLVPLIKLGLGGYIGGRSAEKIVKIWKG